jgi:predicted nucleic acid-binding protein
MGMLLLPPDMALFGEAADLSKEQGLLTNDALVVALMRRHGLSIVATNDDDVTGIPDLSVWNPR